MKKKIIMIRIIYILAFFAIMFLADRVLMIWTGHGIRQAACMYVQPRDSIDVAMMGQSHIHCDVDPYVLYDEYGIASYDMSAAEQPLWITYYYIKEICKYHNPKVIVIDMYTPASFGDTFNDHWMGDNLFGVRFSLNKVKMMYHACSIDQANRFFPSFFGYHSNYDDMKIKDLPELLKRNPDVSFKGYVGYDGTDTEFYTLTDEVTEIADIPPRSQEYLEKILEYTRENNMELFLTAAPHYTTYEKETIYNGIGEWAERNGVPFFNGNRHLDDIGIDIHADFHDKSHLNIEGSRKYSVYLGQMLKERYEIPDRRGDEKYSSWKNAEARGVF